MQITLIHKTEEGKFEIKVSLYISTWGHEDIHEYRVMTSFIPNGKSKPRSLKDETELLPADVLLQAKMVLWNKIKP